MPESQAVATRLPLAHRDGNTIAVTGTPPYHESDGKADTAGTGSLRTRQRKNGERSQVGDGAEVVKSTNTRRKSTRRAREEEREDKAKVAIALSAAQQTPLGTIYSPSLSQQAALQEGNQAQSSTSQSPQNDSSLLSLQDIWDSLWRLQHDIYTECLKVNDAGRTQEALSMPQVNVTTQSSKPEQRQSGHLLSDETPEALIHSYSSSSTEPPPAELWARRFHQGCVTISGTDRKAGRPPSLYCYEFDKSSKLESTLHKGDRFLWGLTHVLIKPGFDDPLATEDTPRPYQGHILQGGIICHDDAGTAGSTEFLTGELRCALTIIAGQLRSQKKFLCDGVDIVQHVQDRHARIVSITSSLLRVLDVRYNPTDQTSACEILISVNLHVEKSDGENMRRLCADWVKAISIALELE